MTRLSKAITAKVRSCLFVLSALREQGPAVAEIVDRQVQASLAEGDEPPRFLVQITALGRHLESALTTMVELDQRLFEARAQRTSRLRERDDLIRALGRRISGLRQILGGHYRAPRWNQLGFAGRIPREPIALLRVSEMVAENLASEEVAHDLGEALFDAPLDLSPYVRYLPPLVSELRAAVEAYDRSRRVIDETLAKEKKAIKAYDAIFLRIARQFEDLCRLAGLTDLAEKVRPSRKRRGQTEVAPGPPESPDS